MSLSSNYLYKFARKLEIEPNRYSCLLIALRDARMVTGRNLETGKIGYDILENSSSFLSPYSFIGVINYLLVLEIIGTVFEFKAFTTKKTNNIYKALKQFTLLKKNDIDTIISLRNSLAHNYGLANIPNDPKENNTKRHIFKLINTENSPLIAYPKIYWDGNFKNKLEDSYTMISVHPLFDTIEDVYSTVISNIERGNIKIALNGGFHELNTRFTIKH
jgi:hypothetical protein